MEHSACFCICVVRQVTVLLVIGVAVFSLGVALGQEGASSSLDIYAAALIEASSRMEKAWGDQEVSDGQSPHDFRHILVAKDESVSADYPQSVDGRRFEYLSVAELLSRRKATSKDFPVLAVRSATLEGERIKVVVSVYWIGIAKGGLLYQLSDWGIVYYRFDCEKGEFRIDEVKLGGV